jgi:hypothetical protein
VESRVTGMVTQSLILGLTFSKQIFSLKDMPRLSTTVVSVLWWCDNIYRCSMCVPSCAIRISLTRTTLS